MYVGGDICPTESNEKFFITGEIEKILDKEIIDKLSGSDVNVYNFETTMTNIYMPIKKCGPNLICKNE